ncbi:MAG: S-layer homology domain-containing protein, partial [bacterium]
MRTPHPCLALAVVLLAGAATPAVAEPFSDVPPDHWSAETIEMLYHEGLIAGYPDGEFKGNR